MKQGETGGFLKTFDCSWIAEACLDHHFNVSYRKMRCTMTCGMPRESIASPNPEKGLRTPLHPSDVCGIVVTYNPPKSLSVTVERLAQQVPYIVLVDNCSKPVFKRPIDQLASKRVEVLQNPRNLGIAAALNQG
ncbi:MAG: glycosyltransferase, partial [Anaerolineales bacterium]